MSKKKKLLQVSAFYKNNQQNGLGFIIFNDEDSTFNEQIIELEDKYEEAWASSDKNEQKEIIKTYFAQLEYFSQLKSRGIYEISFPSKMICLVNLSFLERHGYLKSDEYNGVAFFYEYQREILH
ncbi:MAG: hypothetical protein HQK63_17440 [Desulfamplus sp.]|nr:hypothetical protein [Desulfamplus sp.]